MSEDWAAIAGEIAAAISGVGFAVTLEQPRYSDDTASDPFEIMPLEYEVTAIDDRIAKRDVGGVVTGTKRVLTVSATVTPEKGWVVVLSGVRHRIDAVLPLAPGGVALLYDLELSN